MQQQPCHPVRASRRGFTLTELLIAVGVLVIVILASARIFGTASQITGIGQATSDVMTEAAVIERRLREDLSRLSHEGVFAIRHVAVRNDVNGNALLNPELPEDAIIRADQLVFFATGLDAAQSSRMSDARNNKGQGTATFIYYGHAFQLPDARPFERSNFLSGFAYDASPSEVIYPWSTGNVDMVRTLFLSGAATDGTNVFSRTNGGEHPIIQPGARRWLLARQSAILVDDDGSADNQNGKAVYLNQTTCARSIFFNDPFSGLSPQLRDGRVEAAATELPEIRTRILDAGPWLGSNGQRQRIVNQLLYYPRAERIAPSIARVDQALTNAVIASGCSSFRIDWTYDLGTGATTQTGPSGTTFYAGVSNGGVSGSSPLGLYEPGNEIRWFGYPEAQRGVFPYDWSAWPDGWDGRAQTIDPANIEQFVNHGGFEEYNYVFGFNQTKPFLNPVTGLPDESIGTLDSSVAYTPWPSALRITMTLHDPAARLEGGREFQFIIRLPKRNP